MVDYTIVIDAIVSVKDTSVFQTLMKQSVIERLYEREEAVTVV